MADNTWAVLRWSARSLTQGTQTGAFPACQASGYTRAGCPVPDIPGGDGSEHWLHPFPEGLLCVSHGLAVHPWSRALWNLTQIRPYPLSCDVMGQRGEP